MRQFLEIPDEEILTLLLAGKSPQDVAMAYYPRGTGRPGVHGRRIRLEHRAFLLQEANRRRIRQARRGQ